MKDNTAEVENTPDVQRGDIWKVGNQAYHAQQGPLGIILRPVLLPDQLGPDAVLAYRDDDRGWDRA
jgi:hypothetical protein